jgi:ubiquinone/menaquinone biosynthesis C-methylase UbiE
MKTKDQSIKDMVRSKYNLIATQSKSQNESSCCGSTGCCDTVDYTIMSDDYSQMQGYNPDADLGLGCGLPTQFAQMKSGDTVLDLGSGAGNDCFVARSVVGEKGKVIGLDFAPAMLRKARENAFKLGYTNVEFVKGDIEEMPVTDESVDVIVSNCVLNLVPDKEKAFRQMYRVLKNDGHFSVSDVVLQGELPEALVKDAEMYAGCVSGAIQKDDYLNIISQSGFKNVVVQKEKEIILPDDILRNYLSEKGLEEYKSRDLGIYSITVYAEKNK